VPDLYIRALIFAGGLAALTLGADWLVRGGSRLAGQLGLPPLVIGLTVVAFGTSAPELVVSGGAALRGEPGLALGNVMGSTVANVGLIVGLGALIRPIDVHRRLLVRESPLLVFVLAIVVVLSWNDALGRWDGLALVTGFAIYLFFLVRWGRGDEGAAQQAKETEGETEGRSTGRDVALTVIGLVALLFGAHFVLESAVAIARVYNVPQAVIGASMVAVGTSLPELASTVAAAFRGLGDIAIGNIIGSNVFNLGFVLGSAALLRPLQLPPLAVARMVGPAMVFCVALIPLAYTGMRVERWEGLLLLVGYLGFLYWIF
jgi:cation:H+ antiporter